MAYLVLVRSMGTRAVARCYAAIVVSVILTIVWWRDMFAHHAQGKEAFLAAQARRFDIFYADPSAHLARVDFVVKALVASIVINGALIVVYESIAFGIYKLICRSDHPNRPNQALEPTPDRRENSVQ